MDDIEQLLAQRDNNTRLYVKSGGMPVFYNEEMERDIEKRLREWL
ncbi:MAG: hypothetical protein PHU34_11345 [Candidatus Methanoperedens sp.]|nr:hypothetical protein [Candidatus Methanoperedens sp.]